MSGQGQGHGQGHEEAFRCLSLGNSGPLHALLFIRRSPRQQPLMEVHQSPTQPDSRIIGLPQNLPAPVMGAEDMEAGDWCKFILKSPFPFSVAVSGFKLKGCLLGRLLLMRGVNEPVLRPGWRVDWDAMKFFSRINSSLANVEVVVMQCVGNVITDPEEMCATCSSKKGPFAFCVTVDGIEEYANCHWDKEEHRCSFDKNPSIPKSRRSSKLYTQESEKTTYYSTETVAAYTTDCPIITEGGAMATTAPESIAHAQPSESPSETRTTSTVFTTVTSVTFGTDIATITATYSTHEEYIIESTTTYLITTTIPVTKTLTVGTVVGTVVGTESASASPSAVDISQPAGTNHSTTDESEGESVGSENGLPDYTYGGTGFYPPLKTSHAIAASSSPLSYSALSDVIPAHALIELILLGVFLPEWMYYSPV